MSVTPLKWFYLQHTGGTQTITVTFYVHLHQGDREIDVGFKSHILFYCSDMAEQDVQYTVQRTHTHTHISQHTCGYMERQTKKAHLSLTQDKMVS